MNKNLIKNILVLNLFLFNSIISFSQILSKAITVKKQILTVLETCNLLRQEYKIKIAYSNNDEQLQKQIELKAGTYSLESFLKTNFGGNNIQYQLNGEQLIIIPVKKNSSVKLITISGFVEDEETGEKLPGASVFIPQFQKGTVTNNYGFFTITLSESFPQIIVSYTGYKIYQTDTNFDTDTRLTIKLKVNKDLEEIIVTSSSKSLQSQTQMSKINVPTSIINSMPRFLGEADLLKTLQLLPGVSQGSEATSGLLVRGGAPDQNLLLLDGTPVYNPSHLLGIFSVFNTNALKSVDVYKGGFPARFGSRLSSVVDIITKDGNMKEMHGEGSVGFLSTNLTLEGPLKKDKTSFLISGRRTYLDLISTSMVKRIDENIKQAATNFYDINAKLHHILSPKDRLFISLYSGGDVFKLKYSGDETDEDKFYANWGNTISTVRWNHVFNKKLFANTLINYTNYKFRASVSGREGEQMDNEANITNVVYSSNIYDVGSKIDFDYRPKPEHSIKFGLGATMHTFIPSVLTVQEGNPQDLNIDATFDDGRRQSAEFSVYGEDDWKLSSKFSVNMGFHANAFRTKTKWYTSIQPRVAVRYVLPGDIAFKAAYTHMNQTVHLLANNSVTLPTDLWVPSTDKVKPMLSRQLAVGLAKSVWKNKMDISIESFYKTMENIIEYKDGASYLNSSTAAWESKVEAGKGTAYGIELLIQKKAGKTQGWLGYTFSRSYRIFTTINYGKRFDYKYDRRHDFEIAIIQKLSKNWEISGSWQFQTGTPVTMPVFKYESIEDSYPPGYGEGSVSSVDYVNGRNGIRLLNYHRVDISISWRKKKKRYERTWNLSIYNAYNKQNPFFYFFNRYDNNAVDIRGISILPVLPAITYVIKF